MITRCPAGLSSRRVRVPFVPCALAIGLFSITILLRPIPTTQAQTATSAMGLQELRFMAIVIEDLGTDAEEERITRKMLEDQVLVTIKSKARNLTIDSTARAYLYVRLNLVSSASGYAGCLNLILRRPVEVLVGADRIGSVATRRISTIATVWDDGFIFGGPRGGAEPRTRETLDRLLEAFLADYFRANP